MENEKTKSKMPVGIILILILLGFSIFGSLMTIFNKPVYQLGLIVVTGIVALLIDLIIIGVNVTIFYGLIKRMKYSQKLTIYWFSISLFLSFINMVSYFINNKIFDNYYKETLSPEVYALMLPTTIQLSLVVGFIFGSVIAIVIIKYLKRLNDFFVN